MILQRLQLITGAKNILQESSYDSAPEIMVQFDKLVKDTYIADFPGTQIKEQRHCMISDIVLRGKMCEAVIFVCEWETRRVLQPKKLENDKTGVMDETVA